MKKLFLLFALVLTVSMNAWAADYVAYDYLNDVVCTTDQAYTRIYKEPTLEDPSFAIFMFIKDSGNGKNVSHGADMKIKMLTSCLKYSLTV